MSLTKQSLLNFIKNAATRDGESDLDPRFMSAFEYAGQAALEYIFSFRDWSWMRNSTRVSSIAPYSTGTIAVNVGTDTVTGSGTTFPASAEGQHFIAEGEPGFHDILERDSATALTLKNNYSNESGEDQSGASYQLLFPHYELPEGCRNVTQVILMSTYARSMNLCKTTFESIKELYSRDQATSRADVPYTWSFRRDADGTAWLTLFPAPDRSYALNITYYREPAAFPVALDGPIDIPVQLESVYRTRVGIEMMDQGYQVDRDFMGMFNDHLRVAIQQDATEAASFEFDSHSSRPRNPSALYFPED